MIKYAIMIRVSSLLTGEIKILQWEEFGIEPKDEDVIKIVSDYKERFGSKYNELVHFGYVQKIYVV